MRLDHISKANFERRVRDSERENPDSSVEIAPQGGALATLDEAIQKFPVVFSRRPHPIPSRTRKLSSSEPMVLHGKPCGRVGRCRDYSGACENRLLFFVLVLRFANGRAREGRARARL